MNAGLLPPGSAKKGMMWCRWPKMGRVGNIVGKLRAKSRDLLCLMWYQPHHVKPHIRGRVINSQEIDARPVR